MDKELKTALTELFDIYCFKLISKESFKTIYFLIEEKKILRIKNIGGWSQDKYSDIVMGQADSRKSEAIVAITQRVVVSGKPDSEDMKAVIDGKVQIKDHPLKDEYLILLYMGRNGKNEALFGKIERDPTGSKYIAKQEWAQDVTTHIMGA